MCFGYQPPSLQDVVYAQQERVRENAINEALRAKKFIDKIKQIHLQVHDIEEVTRKVQGRT